MTARGTGSNFGSTFFHSRSCRIWNQGNQIFQNPDLDDANDGTALVALQFSILAFHRYDNAAAAIDASGFMRNDRKRGIKVAHALRNYYLPAPVLVRIALLRAEC